MSEAIFYLEAECTFIGFKMLIQTSEILKY